MIVGEGSSSDPIGGTDRSVSRIDSEWRTGKSLAPCCLVIVRRFRVDEEKEETCNVIW